MKQSRTEFARSSRAMAYRATWVAQGNKVPIPPVPSGWRGAEVYRFQGFAKPIQGFAIARQLDAERGDPPEFHHAYLDACAAECRGAAATLNVLEGPAVREDLEQLGRDAVARLKNPEADRVGRAGAAATLSAVKHLQTAVFEARKVLGRPAPLPVEYGDVDDPFPCLLWLDAASRDAGLVEQAWRLHKAAKPGEPEHVSLVQIGHIMGWVGDTHERTLDIVRQRFKYRKRAARK